MSHYTAKPRAKKSQRSKSPPSTKRAADGKLVKGSASLNPKGRPRGHSFLDELRCAMATVEKQQRRTLLEEFCKRAYESDRVLVSLIDRLVPRLSSVQVEGLLGQMTDAQAEVIRNKLKERFESS